MANSGWQSYLLVLKFFLAPFLEAVEVVAHVRNLINYASKLFGCMSCFADPLFAHGVLEVS